MSKKASQSEKWNFTVSQLRLTHPKTGALLDQFGNFRDDTGECLGVTSDQYGLIQNDVMVNAARAAFEARGMKDYNERFISAQGGRRFYAEFVFANKQLATSVGDVFGYKLTMRNSFDRSIRGSFILGMMRLTCMNGASTLEKEFGLTQKHSLKISVDFVSKALDKALAHGSSALAVYDEMARVEVSDEQGVNILNHLVMADALSGSLREDIKTLWLNPRRDEDKARNIHTLYNAVTEHLTHRVAGERYEYADKVSHGVLFRLVNAARNRAKLAELILPVPQPLVEIKVDAEQVAAAAQAGVIEAQVVG
jgi:hypothetical protein